MKNGNCEIANSTRTSPVTSTLRHDCLEEYYSHDRCQRMESLIIPFSSDRDQPHQSFVIADRVKSRWLVGRYGNNRVKACKGTVGSGFAVVRYAGISNI